MAYFDDTHFGSSVTLGSMIARLFETPFDKRNRMLSQRVAELRALSDAELAGQGLRREDILFHVFGGRAAG